MLGLHSLMEVLTADSLGRLVAGPLGLPKKRKKVELMDLAMCIFFCLDTRSDGTSALGARQRAAARRECSEGATLSQRRAPQTSRRQPLVRESSGVEEARDARQRVRSQQRPGGGVRCAGDADMMSAHHWASFLLAFVPGRCLLLAGTFEMWQ